MKLQSATIKDFKRFTNLTIRNIPSTARLIMLAGPNGCGKSSLFDAFNIWHRRTKQIQSSRWEMDYYSKVTSPTNRFNDQVNISFHEELTGKRRREEENFLHTISIPKRPRIQDTTA